MGKSGTETHCATTISELIEDGTELGALIEVPDGFKNKRINITYRECKNQTWRHGHRKRQVKPKRRSSWKRWCGWWAWSRTRLSPKSLCHILKVYIPKKPNYVVPKLKLTNLSSLARTGICSPNCSFLNAHESFPWSPTAYQCKQLISENDVWLW